MAPPSVTGDAPRRSPQATCLIVLLISVGAFCLLLLVVLAVSFIAFPVVLDSAIGELQEHPAMGQKLPHLELEPLTSAEEAVSLDDLQGKVVVVNFWGTWCPPCRLELPHLVELNEELKDDPGFQLLAVSCGPGTPEEIETLYEDTAAFLDQQGIEMPTYADPDYTARQAFNSIGGFQGYPTTFVLDGAGVIRGVWVGFTQKMPDQIDALVKKLLAEKVTELSAEEE